MRDLFGMEARLPRASLRPQPEPAALDLFTTAAEQRAIQRGRAPSQERAELIAPIPWTPGTCPIHGTPLLLEHAAGYSCPRCA